MSEELSFAEVMERGRLSAGRHYAAAKNDAELGALWDEFLGPKP